MNPIVIVKENWFTRVPKSWALYSTFFLGVFTSVMGYLYLDNSFGLSSWMIASGDSVFNRSEFWRLWTTLFSHADLVHLLSNIVLFLPLAFILSGYFGWWVFPVLGIFMGGVVNWIVLKQMPADVSLIGMSGVVYWMGATWLTLYVFIDRRYPLRRRFASALFITIVLFVPETYKPEISYMSHFVGYVLGLVSGILIYLIRRKEFSLAEKKEYLYETDDVLDELISSPDDVPHSKSVT